MRPRFATIRSILLLILVALLVSRSSAAVAAENRASDVEQSLAALVRTTILESMPRQISGENDWGRQKKFASGLKFSTKEGRLQIDKRTKEVNHGLWTQYQVHVVDPEQRLRVEVAELRRIAPGVLGFRLYLSARLDGEARVERWRRGVKFLNFKAEASTVVEAALDCEVAFRMTPGQYWRDLVVEPRVTQVKLALADIDLHRVSKIDGAAAEELGDRLRHTLDKQLRSEQENLQRKLNEAVQRHPDRLRFSADRLLSAGWTRLQQFLSAGDRSTM